LILLDFLLAEVALEQAFKSPVVSHHGKQSTLIASGSDKGMKRSYCIVS